MGKKTDLMGKRFGRLVVIEPAESRRCKSSVHARWKCRCDCGVEKVVDAQPLIKGTTKSCGCINIENCKKMSDKSIEEFAKEGTRLDLISPTNKKSKNNTSGVTGVSWDTTFQKWNAYIMLKRVRKNLGYYKNKQDAINARKEVEEKYFKPILEKYGKLPE